MFVRKISRACSGLRFACEGMSGSFRVRKCLFSPAARGKGHKLLRKGSRLGSSLAVRSMAE